MPLIHGERGNSSRSQPCGASKNAATDRLTPMEKAAYADDLARKNSEALSFIPRPMIERYAERGQLLLATENGEAAPA
jgi:hypothetical protein